MADATVRQFEAWDWVLFALILGISAAIGIYYAFIGRKNQTTGEFLMGNRNMKLIPVAVSILVSFMSAILILGTPAEMYTEGTQYFIYLFGMIIAVILAALIFVPLLYPLKLTSSFEYLEKRFKSKAAKLTGTILMIIQQILYMGIASFAPSTALEAVTGFPTWATIITVGLVSTFYTFLGGMKAVVWTDFFQSLVMIAGLLAIAIQGAIRAGGLEKVWQINYDWGRIQFFDFNPDPTQRHSFWSLIVGASVGWMSTYGVNQASVQRYSALSTLYKAKSAVLLNIIGVIILVTVTCLAGIVMFAYYATKGCDPWKGGIVANPNQLIPHFVMEILGYPGLPGLFISCLFSGALSTMSSCLNALSAVTWEDILKPFVGNRSESYKTWVTRILVLVYGAAGVGFAFMAQTLGGTVLQASLSFTGAASGPVLGIFLLAGVFPWANWIGCVSGGLIGLALPLWISFGAYSLPAGKTHLLFPTQNCNLTASAMATTLATTTNLTASTVATTSATTTAAAYYQLSTVEYLYTVSYLWYPSIGVATAVVVGLIVSFATGPMSIDDVDPKYLIPLFDRIFCCLPARFRRTLRCNLEFENPEDIKAEEKDHQIIIEPRSIPQEKQKVYENESYEEIPPPPYTPTTNGELIAMKESNSINCEQQNTPSECIHSIRL
ncbi:hypothetical protein CHS0354_009467 [Potamilus streckersoni]|uniref:Sodium-coupled monocarboxylate transporter 1 n=1 Tax=Potamilus streckersoni TaxID=2493646 RepID=A0AAE0VKY2_9BIVA|nr:hypothetical protein CHS0354_009467 [Potamilus streckersoni]